MRRQKASRGAFVHAGREPVVQTTYDPQSDPELGVALTRAVAAVSDTDPTQMEEHLFDSVDVEAVDRLFSDFGTPTAQEGHVAFTFAGHDVVVHGDGQIDLYD